MLSPETVRELRDAWLPNMTGPGLDRLIDLLDNRSPLLVHGCFTKSLPMGCLATHVAWNHPATEHLTVEAGIKDLLILKTTDSGFENYIRDPYTTLKATSDRIFATQCEVAWIYSSPPPDPEAEAAYASIRLNLLKTFAGHKSLSVQHTLYAMGENILKDFPAVKEITLRMPNKHHIPFNMEPFGLENGNEIFMATDEPYGLITGTVVRD